jgi:hypothetical protein
LGSIVPKEKLSNIISIAKFQGPADAAEANMNALITLKRSIDMTIQEMVDMGIDVEELINESEEIKKQVSASAISYAKAKLEAEKSISPLRAKIIAVSQEVESPIDYNQSALKQMPLSADSLQMNAQYFSSDKNDQTSDTHASTISAFVSASLSRLGTKATAEAAGTVRSQVNSQHENHSIAGTLVMCITCTHKTAQVFAPFILDVDKAVRSWNKLFPSKMIKTDDAKSLSKIEEEAETTADNSFNILSGATYGSSFVGMVHVLNTTDTMSRQDMNSVASSLQATFDVGAWVAKATGGFGVESSFSKSAKSLLSMQKIQSHCSAVTMGIIPSIKSNSVKMAVKQFADFDPAKQMGQLAALQGATAGANNSVASAANAARTGKEMTALQNSTIEAALNSVAEIDEGQNNIINTNSMMTAMDDYIDKCISGGGNVGVPINYFLKPITRSMVAQAWLAKYYPNEFDQGRADDSTPNSTSSNNTNPPPSN